MAACHTHWLCEYSTWVPQLVSAVLRNFFCFLFFINFLTVAELVTCTPQRQTMHGLMDWHAWPMS